MRSFDDYLELEQRLFRELDEKVYRNTETRPGQEVNRFHPGSLSDPRDREPNWNRTFVLEGSGRGGVLLLHGMSDSPYSLRAIGLSLNQQGYDVIGLRLPGHGTAPSGLKYVSWRDMAAAVGLAMQYLDSKFAGAEHGVHMIGYSTGASLALAYTVGTIEGEGGALPDSLVLISPAIRVSPAAGLARIKNSLSVLPGLEAMAWLDIIDEFDPYKYNSFATNAGYQVHRVTSEVDRRITALSGNAGLLSQFPPVLVLKSTVDSTVTTDAVVDHLLKRLPSGQNELVLFDINRQEVAEEILMVSDPGPLTKRLFEEENLPFTVTFVTNENRASTQVVARRRHEAEPGVSGLVLLGLAWPDNVLSLSHVAVPFPPDDPLYGATNPGREDQVYLGDLAFRGERGLLRLPAEWLLRMRFNPFYPYLEQRVIQWLENPGGLD